MSRDEDIDSMIGRVLLSRQYRELGIPAATVHDLLEKELQTGSKPKEALKQAKRKLHNIVAAYLGDPDYSAEMQNLSALFSNTPTLENERTWCQALLMTHASSRERMPNLEVFYQKIFAITAKPQIILDLACALHPFSIPWMDLSGDLKYHAYDIHQPRVDLINHYFRLRGMAPLAEKRDIILNPPDIQADVTFIFKETHRMEKRERGCSRTLWQALNTDWLVISLPASSLNGEHDLRTFHRQMVQDIVKDLNWKILEDQAGGELLFFINKR